VDEDLVTDKIQLSSPIFHSWLRREGNGVVGLKFSTWMINTTVLTKKEKETVGKWEKSDSEFAIFFGGAKEYDEDASSDEVVKYTSIVKLDKVNHGISFPLFGPTLDKVEMAQLETKLGYKEA
jgi:hypothetical protein